jgi:hypothetical protein
MNIARGFCVKDIFKRRAAAHRAAPWRLTAGAGRNGGAARGRGQNRPRGPLSGGRYARGAAPGIPFFIGKTPDFPVWGKTGFLYSPVRGKNRHEGGESAVTKRPEACHG